MKKNLKLKEILAVLLSFLLSVSLSAQSTFYKNYDFAGDDFGNFVIETSDGGYAIIGSTNSLGAGAYDVWLLKTDSSGDTLWTKTYGGIDNDEGYCLRETSDNGFIIAAYKTVPQQYTDGWVFKTDATGNIEWEHTFGTELNGESASSLVSAGDNTFLVSGNLNSKSYVFKIDEVGNIIWEKTYFSNKNSSTTSICSTSDNGFAVAGSFQLSSGGNWYPNIFKIDGEGEIIYQMTYINGVDYGSFQFIIGTSDAGLVYGGFENEENVVHKIQSSGMEVWNYNFPSQYMTYASSATETSDGNIVIADNSWYASLRKLNASGDTLWTRTSTFNNDYPKFTNLTTTSDNGLIITGYTDNHDLILVKTLENGSMSGIDSPISKQNSAFLKQNTPNPFTENTTLNFTIATDETIELYITDIQGNRIKTIVNDSFVPGDYHFLWDGNNINGSPCPPGIYFSIMKTKNYKATQKLIKALK